VGRASLTAAWLFGLGLITYRNVARNHQPPVPGTLLAASGFFAMLALAAEYQPAAGAAALIGWGVDLAALLNILPGSLAGPAKTTAASTTGPAPGTAKPVVPTSANNPFPGGITGRP
jgi:hypothetical protein